MREWLRNSRVEKNMTMKELGERLGISESYYSSIEAGIKMRRMDISFAVALSSALDIPIAEIIRLESDDSMTNCSPEH